MIWGPGLPGPQGIAGAQGPQGVTGAAGAPGKVLQVVHASTTTPVTVSGAAAWADTTLTATITPSLVSSKVLVFCYHQIWVQNQTNGTALTAIGAIRLVRGSTTVWSGWNNGTGPIGLGVTPQMVSAVIDNIDQYGQFSIGYLDSPASTAPTTYKTQCNNYASPSVIYCQPSGTTANGRSDIILMEIAA